MDKVEYFKQTLNADIHEYGLTPLLFDQMVAFLRDFVLIENDSLYKVLAVEMAFLLTKNRGFYKKTIRPIVLRIFGKKSFLYTNLAILKQIALCALLLAKSTKRFHHLEFYREEFTRRIRDELFIADCRLVLTETHNHFYYDGCGMVWIHPQSGQHELLFRIKKDEKK